MIGLAESKLAHAHAGVKSVDRQGVESHDLSICQPVIGAFGAGSWLGLRVSGVIS